MRPWRDSQGEIGGIVIFVEDITAQKRAQEALLKSEERYRHAIEASNEGIWEWDLRADEVVFSTAFYRMLGYKPSEGASQKTSVALDLMRPHDLKWAPAAARERLASDGHYQLKLRLRAKDGSYHWILSRGKVVERDENGEPIRAVGTHTDITAQERAEHSLKESEA